MTVNDFVAISLVAIAVLPLPLGILVRTYLWKRDAEYDL